MGSNRFLYLASVLCLALAAGLWVGCQSGQTSPGDSRTRVILSTKTNDAAGDYRRVELEDSADPEQSQAQLQRWAQELRQQGWLILAVSKPQLQPDGTVRREYVLKRAKP